MKFILILVKFVSMRKMRSLFAVLVGLLLSCITAYPQTIHYSNDIKFGFRKNEFAIAGRTDHRNITYRTDAEVHYLDIFSDSMTQIAVVELDFLPRNAQTLNFFTTAQRIILLYQYAKSGIQYAMMAQMDTDGRLLQQPLKLDSVKSSSRLFTGNNAPFDFVIADNKNYFSVFSRFLDGKQEYLNTKLFQSDGKPLGNKDVLLSADKPVYPRQFVLNNKGTLFFTAHLNSDREHRSDFADIYLIDFKEDRFSRHPVPLNGSWIEQLYIQADQETEAVDYTAFYTTGRKGNIEGVIYGRVFLEDDKAPTFKQNKFSPVFLSKVSTRNKKKVFENFDIRNVIVKKDGGIMLIAENYYITTRTSVPAAGFYSSYYGMTPSRVITEYNYGDILIINFDGQGNMVWDNIIRKSQYSQEDKGLFSSFAFMNTGRYLVFVYNDYTYNKNSLTVAAIDNQGQTNYKHVKISDRPYDWVPKYALQTSALSLLIPCFRSNTITFAAMYL